MAGAYSFLTFAFLLLSREPLSLLHCPLSPKRIDVRLSIIGFLLHLPQMLGFSLFLILDSALFGLELRFLSSLCAIVSGNFLLFLLFLEDALFLNEDCALVGSEDLIKHFFRLDLLRNCGLGVVLLELRHCLKHKLPFFLLLFLGPDSDQLSLLDLPHDHVVILL